MIRTVKTGWGQAIDLSKKICDGLLVFGSLVGWFVLFAKAGQLIAVLVK